MGSMSASRGPGLWTTWQETDKSNGEAVNAHEFPFFSDAEIVWNEEDSLGPVRVFRTLLLEHNRPVEGRPGVLSLGTRPHPTAVLFARIERRREPIEPIELNWEKTDPGSYHGAGDEEELAALLSLIYGARIRSGPPTRRYSTIEGTTDSGSPLPLDPSAMPTLPYVSPLRRIVPDVFFGQKRLTTQDTELLRNYPKLTGQAATALVRAARWYQNGLWICDQEPSIAWLMLISALEVAAVEWYAGTDQTPETVLADAKPEFSDALKKISPEAHTLVAKTFWLS
jgi:hypothetical protein